MENINSMPESFWVWKSVVAQVVEVVEDDHNDLYGRIIYARLVLVENYSDDDFSFTIPEPDKIISCQMYDHLIDKDLYGGELVLLEVNERNRSYTCFDVFYDEYRYWVWNFVVGQVIKEDHDIRYGRILYARLVTNYCDADFSFTIPDPEQIVSCQMYDHLIDGDLYGGELVLLEVDEENGRYTCFNFGGLIQDQE